jgi:hypothetical protein
MGLTLTDRTDGDQFNRVAGIDTRILFKREYTFNGHLAASATRDASGETHTAPLWNISANRTGLRFGFLYSFNAVAPDFAASSGFLPRTDFVKGSFYNRYSFYGRPGGLIESWLIRQGLDGLWLYDKFRDGDSVQETKFQLENVFNIRGGWIVSLTPVTESFLFDVRRYTAHSVLTTADTIAFTPSPRTQAVYGLVRVNTPQYSFFSGRFTSFLGRDVDFFETAPAHRTDVTADIDFRPSDQLRLTTSYLYSRITRWRDNSMLSSASVPRLKVEYQLSRPLFLRFVGQYDNRKRDALRDPATDAPLLINDVVASRQDTRDFRVDWLVSYLPSPGTVVFAGYGASLTEQDAFCFGLVVVDGVLRGDQLPSLGNRRSGPGSEEERQQCVDPEQRQDPGSASERSLCHTAFRRVLSCLLRGSRPDDGPHTVSAGQFRHRALLAA